MKLIPALKHRKRNKKEKISIIILFMIIACLLCPLLVQGFKEDLISRSNPLLLNSELTNCNQAFVKIILWTESKKAEKKIVSQLSSSNLKDLNWTRQELKNTYGNLAYRYSTEFSVNKQQEKILPDMLNTLHHLLSSDVRIYFQESIDENIDSMKYLELLNCRIKDSITSDGVISISGSIQGYHDELTIDAEFVNIQILTTENSKIQKTVLAFPALLEEF